MQLVWLVKEVALTLNAHFPGRLGALWVVEAPVVVKWPLRALRKLLHPATGQKIQTCSIDDPALPQNITPELAAGQLPEKATEPSVMQVDNAGHFWYV